MSVTNFDGIGRKKEGKGKNENCMQVKRATKGSWQFWFACFSRDPLEPVDTRVQKEDQEKR